MKYFFSLFIVSFILLFVVQSIDVVNVVFPSSVAPLPKYMPYSKIEKIAVTLKANGFNHGDGITNVSISTSHDKTGLYNYYIYQEYSTNNKYLNINISNVEKSQLSNIPHPYILKESFGGINASNSSMIMSTWDAMHTKGLPNSYNNVTYNYGNFTSYKIPELPLYVSKVNKIKTVIIQQHIQTGKLERTLVIDGSFTNLMDILETSVKIWIWIAIIGTPLLILSCCCCCVYCCCIRANRKQTQANYNAHLISQV